MFTSQGHLGEESLSLALDSAQANCVVPILQSFRGLSDTHRYPCPPSSPDCLVLERQQAEYPHTPYSASPFSGPPYHPPTPN